MSNIKIYTLSIAYNEETEEVEYLQEELIEDESLTYIPCTVTDYWDEETIDLFRDVYSIAKA